MSSLMYNTEQMEAHTIYYIKTVKTNSCYDAFSMKTKTLNGEITKKMSKKMNRFSLSSASR